MYYHRSDVKTAISDFANSSVSYGSRECAIFNSNFKSVQRYIGENGSKRPIDLRTSDFDGALASGASAFYFSYWRYDGADFTHPIGRDFVWTLRAKHGGLFFAKFMTKMVLEALQGAGIEPWVKYSGDLGFDVIIPLETVPREAWPGDTGILDEIYRNLTSHIIDHIRENFRELEIRNIGSSTTLKIGNDVCLLSELRVRRGLLLAPMSLNPATGLISVPVDPRRLESFKIWDATQECARPVTWPAAEPAHGLLRFAAQQHLATEAAAETV